MDERQIISSILDGNFALFEKLVEKYKDMAFSIAFRILENKEDAEDITQESFLKAFNALSSFKYQSKFSTWFYRIVYNMAINQGRISYIDNVSFEDYFEENTDLISNEIESLDSIKRKEIIELVLSKMPADESISITLFYLEEFSIEEVAEITGWSNSNVKVKLFRGRKRFYELLKTYMKTEINCLL